ncbi:MAG: ABC transporter permease [Treponema sp.]|nr:ABC transporter permease [Treponema sp.]
MTFKSSVLYAARIFFSRPGAERSNGKRSLIGAMACIGISLVPLVAVLVISQGMIDGITGRMIGLSSQDLQVRVSSYSEEIDSLENMESFSERLADVNGVLEVIPEMQGMALAAGNGIRTGATVRAMHKNIFSDVKSFSSLFKVVEGTVSLEGERDAVLCEKIAQSLGVHAGDKVSLISINKIGETMVPKMREFNVEGIVSSGYQELDALWVFIPLETGYDFLSIKSSQFIFGLVTEDPFAPSLMSIKAGVSRNIRGMDSYPAVEQSRVYTWNELNAAEYENFASTKILLLLIMLLIVLVASVNISSALVMVVMERRREIAILKSMGASEEGIKMSFILVGFAAGAGGTLIGIPLGLLAAVNINPLINIMEKMVNICAKFVYLIGRGELESFSSVKLLDPAYYLQDIPVSVPFGHLLLITAGTLVLSLVVSIIPAAKAGREKPLDTLRKM